MTPRPAARSRDSDRARRAPRRRSVAATVILVAAGALQACDGARIGEPRALWALWVAPLLVAFFVASSRSRARSLRRFAAPALLERLAGAGGGRRRALKSALVIAAVIAMLSALARVQVGYTWQEVERKGVDIVVALDVSDSMLVEDAGSVDRLERAKRELADLLRIVAGDRIGIVAFAGVAFVQCPLTTDYGAAELFLRALDADAIPVQGTDLEQALSVSLAAFRGGAAGSRAVLLITDGEDHSGRALEAAEKLRAEGVRVFAIGIGSAEGAPVPARGGGFRRDRSGAIVLSRLDEPTLQQIALTTGGRYVRSVTGDLDLETIYVDGIKAMLEDRELDAERRQRWEDRFQWLLGASLLLLMIESLVSERGRARREAQAPARLGAGAKLRAGEAAGPDGAMAAADGRPSARPSRAASAALALLLLAPWPTSVRGQERDERRERDRPRLEIERGGSDAGAGEASGAADDAGSGAGRDHVSAVEDVRYRTPEEAYAAGAFEQALEGFLDLQIERPEDAAVTTNVGSAQYRLGDFEAAARSFESAGGSAAEDRVRAQAFYDLGNTAYRQGRLEEAIEHWHRSLDLDPADQDAKWNVELARVELERKRQQEQEQQQQRQQQEQGDQGDQGDQQPEDAEGASESGAGEDDSRQSQQGGSEAPEQNEPRGAESSQQEGRSSPRQEGQREGSPAGAGEEGAESGRMTQAEAERLLDALEEGRPRRRVGAGRRRAMEKDW
jgi:Ca-activated chloride channel family protein